MVSSIAKQYIYFDIWKTSDSIGWFRFSLPITSRNSTFCGWYSYVFSTRTTTGKVWSKGEANLEKKKENSHICKALYILIYPLFWYSFYSQSDIYSIGIVLIQLLTLIKTLMELCSIITSLKSGQVPEALKRHKWVSLKYI